MLSPFRRVLARPGAALFCATGLVARLPIAMVGLGIVLLVEAETGSYGLAGALSATHVLANAATAVLQGRLADRLGQARVLPLTIAVWGAALAGLVWSVESDWPVAWAFVLAGVAGAALPSVGACVRARWAHVLADPSDADARETAFALEAVVDEAVFITGPVLVTLLATGVDPGLGLGAAVLAGVGGTWTLAAQRRTEPPAHRHAAGVARARMPWRDVAPLVAMQIGLGALFGSVEVITVAFTDERDATSLTGVLLALWALGSLLAGIVSGSVTWRRPLHRRLRIGAALMAATMAPLPFLDPVWLMALWLLLAGSSIAPTLIATIALAERVVPPSRLTEGMGLLQTGLLAGVSLGAAVAGPVIDGGGASAAYLVPLGAGLLASAAALATRASEPSRGAVASLTS